LKCVVFLDKFPGFVRWQVALHSDILIAGTGCQYEQRQQYDGYVFHGDGLCKNIKNYNGMSVGRDFDEKFHPAVVSAELFTFYLLSAPVICHPEGSRRTNRINV
jgi:hypothetical protein